MRLVPRSLHLRMLLLSMTATLVALVLAGWTIAGVLGRVVTAGLDRRLDAEITLLASTIDADGRVDRPLLGQRVAALDGGPGWRWRIETRRGAIGSADFPALDPGPLPERHRHGPGERADRRADRFRPIEGASERGVGVHGRQLTVHTRAGPVVLTTAAPREVVRRPILGALGPLLAGMAALAVLLGGATLLQLHWGLKPLRALRDQVAAIRAGRRERVDEDQPSELRPLAVELNQLAADNAAALAGARRSAANLAHALKTPVATLALTLRDKPDQAAQVARIDATIRHHLARARVEAIDRRASTPLAPAIADLVATVRSLHEARWLTFDVDVPADLVAAVDPRDVDEIVGNLLDNAARYAAGRVRVAATSDGDPRRVRIAVVDDGPGIPVAAREAAARPGTRLDERGDGHGFGLAIVGELTALYGGAFLLADTATGGLAATVDLPRAG